MKYIIYFCMLFLMISCHQVPEHKRYSLSKEDPDYRIEGIFYNKNLQGIKPRIAIVSHYTLDNNNVPMVRLAIENHSNYARKHGYDYFFRNGTITDKYTWEKGRERISQLGLYWQKIYAVKQLLNKRENQKKVYDYVMWIDSDAYFTNHKKIENFIADASPDTYFMIAEDLNSTSPILAHSCVNSGVFIVKNSKEGLNFIENVNKAFDIYKSTSWPEQLAIQDLAFGFLDTKDVGTLKSDSSKLENFKDKIKWRNCSKPARPGVKIFYMRDFNAAYHWPNNPRVAWNKDSFVTHFLILPGQSVYAYAKVLLECLRQTNFKRRNRCNPYNLNILIPEKAI